MNQLHPSVGLLRQLAHEVAHLLEVRLDYTDMQRMSHVFQKSA